MLINLKIIFLHSLLQYIFEVTSSEKDSCCAALEFGQEEICYLAA